MAILYGFFDESGKHKDHPVVTFSGVCCAESQLPRFNEEWNRLLRFYAIPSLHMKKASQLTRKVGERMPANQPAADRCEALKPFADCINSFLEVGLSQAWDVAGFNSLSKEAKAGLGNPSDPYYMGFARGLMEIIDFVQPDDRIIVVCDHDPETAWDCYRHYEAIRRANIDIRRKVIALTFADDEYFPALQAADMIAYLSRREARRRFYKDRYDFKDLFDYTIKDRGVGKIKWFEMFADEERIRGLSTQLVARPLKKKT